jgi:hypothetical protein
MEAVTARDDGLAAAGPRGRLSSLSGSAGRPVTLGVAGQRVRMTNEGGQR